MIKNLLIGTAAGALLALSLWANVANADNYKEGRMYECTTVANAYIEVATLRDLGTPLTQLLVVLEDYPEAWTAISCYLPIRSRNPRAMGQSSLHRLYL